MTNNDPAESVVSVIHAVYDAWADGGDEDESGHRTEGGGTGERCPT